MTAPGSFARRVLHLRLLRLALTAGAALDLALAAGLVWRTQDVGRWLGAVAATPFYPRVLAVQLALLGALQLLASRSVRRYSAVILIAIAGRLALAGVLALAAASRPAPGLPPLLAAELAVAAGTIFAWWPVRPS